MRDELHGEGLEIVTVALDSTVEAARRIIEPLAPRLSLPPQSPQRPPNLRERKNETKGGEKGNQSDSEDGHAAQSAPGQEVRISQHGHAAMA